MKELNLDFSIVKEKEPINSKFNSVILGSLFNSEIKPEFLFFLLKSMDGGRTSSRYKSNLMSLNITNVNDIKIPLPPISVQNKIIRRISDVEKNELKARQKILNLNEQLKSDYIIEKNKWPVYKLSDVVEIIGRGNASIKRTKNKKSNIPCVSVGDMNFHKRFIDSTRKYVSEKESIKNKVRILKIADLIISVRRHTGIVAQTASPMTYSSSCYGFRGMKSIENNYLYYSIKHEIQILNSHSHSPFDSLTREIFDLISIPVPSQKQQKKIVYYFDKSEENINLIKNILKNIDDEKEKILKEYL